MVDPAPFLDIYKVDWAAFAETLWGFSEFCVWAGFLLVFIVGFKALLRLGLVLGLW